MKFSEKLKLLRKETRYSQEYLAEQCGVSRQAVSKWESNIAYPETAKLLYLSQLFNVSIDYLIKDEITEKTPNDTEQASILQAEDIDYSDFVGHWCNIELQNWDSGYYEVVIVAQNKTYLMFFQGGRKSILKLGIVRKEYIDEVYTIQLSTKKLNKYPIAPNICLHENENPFARLKGKICDIQFHSKNLASFILSNDGYQKSEVLFIDENKMKIRDGKSNAIIKLSDIAGIVES